MDIIGVVSLIVTVIGVIVGAAVAIVLYQRQEKLQRELAEKQVKFERELAARQEKEYRKQRIREINKDLASYLTRWVGDLRTAVQNADLYMINEMQASLRQLVAFEGGVTYQGQLGNKLIELESFPECKEVAWAVRDFENTVVGFKMGAIDRLKHLIEQYGQWRDTNPDVYDWQKAE